MRLIALALVLLWTRLAAGQASPYGWQEIKLFSGTVTATSDLTLLPSGGVIMPVGLVRHGVCMLATTAASGTMDLYLQSVVGGIDDDYCRFPQTTTTGNQILRFTVQNALQTGAGVAVADRGSTVTAGNCRAGSLGGNLKIAAVISGGGSFTFTLTCSFSGDA